ncbi:MAG: hypothetical protein L0Y58_20965, partial [Verrucomicrobia subdivision 3 bacterium]|nr:hypothetical protein [Limisphaerales bacterium]
MRSNRMIGPKSQRGVALLIAIFSLLLISGAAIGMIVMAGTESSINANYRRSTVAFYHSMAGLEEARERLVPCSPNTFWPVTACANPPASADLLFNDNPPSATASMVYMINPGPGDPPVFNPAGLPAGNKLADATLAGEYQFVAPPVPGPLSPIPSSPMATAGGQPPLDYKWVRITLKTERMAGVQLDNILGNLDEVLPVRVDSTGRQCLPTMPGCAFDPDAPITTRPVFRATAMAVSPTGESRLLQAEMAQLPTINPSGAIASKAGIDISGNFNAFGAWPPIVRTSCTDPAGKKVNIDTCGTMGTSGVQGDCSQPFSDGGTSNDPTDDMCGNRPRPTGDFCSGGIAANALSSEGNIVPSGNYSTSPDSASACSTNNTGCIFTAEPKQAMADQQTNWPYDMAQIMEMLKPPVTKPIQVVDPTIPCTTFDSNGNRVCQQTNITYGTLPNPWPPLPGTQPTDHSPELVFADVGPGGLLKISGNGSVGSGILVVDGDLEVTGGLEYYGIIIVRGTVK